VSTLEQNLNPDPGKPPANNEADAETIYYEGHPRLRGELGMLLTWTVVAVVLIGVGYLLWQQDISGIWVMLGLFVAGILAVCVPAILVRRSRYKLTNYRIDYEFGILFKRYETLELWHVDDIKLSQSPLDRILRVGTIEVLSTDKSTPRLELRSLPEPKRLLDLLKQRVIAVKRQRGVVKLDMG
jgi:membrane protein YdbS with pleckstrin-like domain